MYFNDSTFAHVRWFNMLLLAHVWATFLKCIKKCERQILMILLLCHVFLSCPTNFIDFMLSSLDVVSAKLRNTQRTCCDMVRSRPPMSTKPHCAWRLAPSFSGQISASWLDVQNCLRFAHPAEARPETWGRGLNTMQTVAFFAYCFYGFEALSWMILPRFLRNRIFIWFFKDFECCDPGWSRPHFWETLFSYGFSLILKAVILAEPSSR